MYYGAQATQSYNVAFAKTRCSNTPVRTSDFDSVNIPPKAAPQGGSDNEMIVYNRWQNRVFEFS